MSNLAIRYYATGLITAVLLAALFAGCSDDGGTKPVDPGTLRGVVQLPFKFASETAPIEGASVRLTIGDVDTTAITNANGVFLFPVVPAGIATVEATFGSCLRDVNTSVGILSNFTTDITLTLESETDFDTISIGWPSPVRMEISPDGIRSVMLFNSAARGGGAPGIATVDLTTGVSVTRELDDLDDVFDVKILSTGLAVFNYRQGETYAVRFVDPVTLLTSGNDVIYHVAEGITQHDGRLAPLPSGQDVFVTHGTREISTRVTGWLYCVSVPFRVLADPDDDVFNGEFGFSNELVDGALRWAYNVAYDPARNEVLVGNRDSTIVTAIDLSYWGAFDRDAHLSLPTEGVRHIDLEPPSPYDQGFGMENWDFAGGVGIGSKLRSGPTPIMRYTSGDDAHDLYYLELSSFPASTNHTFRIVPFRESWYSIFSDLSRAVAGRQRAVEERSIETLARVYRYESRFVDNPTPMAFAVDAAAGLLYVTYQNATFIEVFCLP